MQQRWTNSTLIKWIKSNIINWKKVYDITDLGLKQEYGKLVSAITSVLKFETMAGVEGVDRGEEEHTE